MSLQKPVTVTVHDQAMAYNHLAPSFPTESLGQWVLIAGLKSLGFYETAEEAERAADDQGFDYPNSSPDHRACNSLTPLPLSSRRPSVSIGGFGLSSPSPSPSPGVEDLRLRQEARTQQASSQHPMPGDRVALVVRNVDAI